MKDRHHEFHPLQHDKGVSRIVKGRRFDYRACLECSQKKALRTLRFIPVNLLGVGKEYGNILYRDYIEVTFLYSPLPVSK